MAVSRVPDDKANDKPDNKVMRTISLYKLFLRYLAVFCMTTVLLLGVIVLSVEAGFRSGFVLQANYAERAVGEVRDRIAQSKPFDRTLIPFPCTYILLDKKDGKIVESDMDPEEIERARDRIRALLNNTSQDAMHQYVLIQRDDTVCVVCYDMYVHFASPVLDRWLPKPELLWLLVLLGLFLLNAFVTAVRFGRRLNRELEPIVEAVDRIACRELKPGGSMTGIREFNAVLHSIQDMEKALEQSLKEQWEMEQNRRMQISAVAHDLKIPLTVVRGNVELLLEEDFSGGDRELLEGIRAGAGRIEQYTGLLSDAVRAESAEHMADRLFAVEACVGEIEQQAACLCRLKEIALTVRKAEVPAMFYGDRELIVRAVSNILDNAVEHSPVQGTIEFFVEGCGSRLVFRVTDSGTGFSDNALKYAAQQFYTECRERSGKHYGLGLFIADRAAHQHGGSLQIANRQDGEGAVVTLTVVCVPDDPGGIWQL